MVEFKGHNSWLSRIFFSSFFLFITIFAIDFNYTILPINGVLLFLYLLFVSLLTMWITLSLLQNLLKHNKPLEYNFNNKYIKLLKDYYLTVEGKNNTSIVSKCIDERINDFSMDTDKYFISKWYKHISDDETFTNESRLLLEDVTWQLVQTLSTIDSKKLTHGLLIILLKHLKEFRKTIKRQQKNGGNLEDLYRFSHVGSKTVKDQQQYLNSLTASVLQQFIKGELWNSLPCQALVSILSRKLTGYTLNYISKPGFLNYIILTSCTSEKTKENLNIRDYSFISLYGFVIKTNEEVIKKFEKDDDSSTPRVSPKKIEDNGGEFKMEQLVEVVDSLKENLMEFTSNAVSEPVKIYESKSANKTWRISSDLECISLGQDPLTLQENNDPDTDITHFIEKKLWKDNNEVDDKRHPINDIQEILTTEEVICKKPSPPSFLRPSTTNTILTNTIKPIGNVTASTLHNMKELQQSTVNNVVKPVSQATTTAMHKIGDLQDEAAGMVEGIIDFGMAGLRKGLRLTGLQDNAIDNKKKIQEKKLTKLTKLPHVTSEDVKITSSVIDADESVWVNPLVRESPNFDGQILLERTPDSISKPFFNELTKTKDINDVFDGKNYDIPHISTESPDPEYEETADFATTIAKLRSLLQQKSSESNLTTPALSPMPSDEVLKTTPIDPPAVQDINEVDGVMPSLYKFCARTATGVFQNTLNTIKTALPGNVNDIQRFLIDGDREKLTFVEDDSSSNEFLERIEKVLNERRFCTVDTACEALDASDATELTTDWLENNYEDELDDFELDIPIMKSLVDIFCELITDTNTIIAQEPVIKSVLLLTGAACEKTIEERANKFIRSISSVIGHLPQNLKQNTLPMSKDKMIEVCTSDTPVVVKRLLGESTVEAALKFLIFSLQSQKINEDVCMQIFDLVASQLIYAKSKLSPAYSA